MPLKFLIPKRNELKGYKLKYGKGYDIKNKLKITNNEIKRMEEENKRNEIKSDYDYYNKENAAVLKAREKSNLPESVKKIIAAEQEQHAVQQAHNAAASIQEVVRRRILDPDFKYYKDLKHAAKTVQSVFRGNKYRYTHIAGPELQKIRELKEAGFISEDNRILVPGPYSGEQIGPDDISSVDYLYRELTDFKNAAATEIQRMVRGHLTRKNLNIPGQHAAAAKIQGAFREHLGRKANAAATKIQSVVRGHLTRKRLVASDDSGQSRNAEEVIQPPVEVQEAGPSRPKRPNVSLDEKIAVLLNAGKIVVRNGEYYIADNSKHIQGIRAKTGPNKGKPTNAFRSQINKLYGEII